MVCVGDQARTGQGNSVIAAARHGREIAGLSDLSEPTVRGRPRVPWDDAADRTRFASRKSGSWNSIRNPKPRFSPESSFSRSHGTWDQRLNRRRSSELSRRSAISSSAICSKRSARWQKVGRAFENAYLRFEIVMDIGSYRDLASPSDDDSGTPELFDVPRLQRTPLELQQAGLASRFEEAIAAGRSPVPEDSSRSTAILRSTSFRWLIACGSISGRTSGSCSGRRN